MSRAGALLLACLLATSVTLDVAAQEPPQDAQPRSGTVVEFHGWSPDSQYVAYTRSKRAATRRGRGKPRLTRRSHHRRVKDGRFQGTGSAAADQHIPRYAERKGYVVPALERMEVSDTETWFVGIEGTYKLRLTVGETLVWELSFEGEPSTRSTSTVSPASIRRRTVGTLSSSCTWIAAGATRPPSIP